MTIEDQRGTDRKDDALLQEIRDTYDYFSECWKDIREQGNIDMRFISGDPWDAQERGQRKDLGRPCIAFDELTQYTNQLGNDVRQNRRGIKVVPKGSGANDKTALVRAGIIRQWEYRSNAQAAYSTAFDGAVSRSYGYFRIRTKYSGPGSITQDAVIERIPNPDTVMLDPDSKESDYSDGTAAFVTDTIPRKQYKRKYPNATVTDFSPDLMATAPKWISDKSIQIAEYWKVKTTKRKLLQLDNGTQDGLLVYVSTATESEKAQIPTLEESAYVKAKGKDGRATCIVPGEIYVPPQGKVPGAWQGQPKVISVEFEREDPIRQVIQYITNGVEILEENKWVGSWIPIIGVFGKELFVDDGSGPKRKLMSLVRLARDPQMLLNYYRTTEAEVVALPPKVPYIGYEGQFATSTDWANINKQPVAYAEVKPMVDPVSGQVLPLPRREEYNPPIQSLELGAEACRRAIQSAMGISGLPTAAQRQNEKSGVALEKIQTQQSQGSFHFIDNLNGSIEYCGRQLNELVTKLKDTPQDVSVRGEDDEHKVVRVNDPDYVEEGKQVFHDLSAGEHEVTINVGPTYQSQREQADAFGDSLLQALPTLPIAPPAKSKLVAQMIRQKDLGPIGDAMADTVDPPPPDGQQPLPPEAQAQIAKQQQAIQALNAHAQNVEQEVQRLQQEKQAKILDNQYKMQIADLEGHLKLAMQDKDLANKLAIAEITAKSQELDTRMEFEHKQWLALHQAAHDVATQAVDQNHDQNMAAAAHDQQLEQQQQAASLQPQPEASGGGTEETPAPPAPEGPQ